MSGDCIKTFKLEVEIQENGIIRDPFGWIIGRCNDDWLRLVTRHEMEPNGLTVSNDGELINWRGENYIKQRVDYLCDTCRYANIDRAGYFMCLDYAPPEYGGEAFGPIADKLPIPDCKEPHELCLSWKE